MVGYKRGAQATEKMQLITFLGWTLNQKKWDSSKRITNVNVHKLNIKDKLTLWYTMYGQNTPLPLPFRTASKRIFQWNKVHNLSHLEERKHYVAWCMNAIDDANRDISGEWFWIDTLNVTGPQANDILQFKKSRRDVDAFAPRRKIECIAEMGYPHGNQFFDMLTEMYGDDPKGYEYRMAYEKYMKANGKKKVTKKLEQFNEQVKKAQQINDLLDF